MSAINAFAIQDKETRNTTAKRGNSLHHLSTTQNYTGNPGKRDLATQAGVEYNGKRHEGIIKEPNWATAFCLRRDCRLPSVLLKICCL